MFYFGQKDPINFSNFETFKCSVKHLPNSSCHFSNQKSTLVTPLYIFKPNVIYFEKKKPIKVETLRILSAHASSCNSENLHSDRLVLTKAYKVLDEKSTENLCLMTLKGDPRKS